VAWPASKLDKNGGLAAGTVADAALGRALQECGKSQPSAGDAIGQKISPPNTVAEYVARHGRLRLVIENKLFGIEHYPEQLAHAD
jgi:hypothetical protein